MSANDRADAPRGTPAAPRGPSTARHAFLVMAHEDPTLLRTLLSLLDDERNDIYLHVDSRATAIDVEGIASGVCHAGVEVLESMAVNWGGFSQVRCELALLERATRSPHAYYHLLSGADLPLVDQDTLHSFFARARGAEYVHFVPGPLPDHVVRRVAVRWLFPERARAAPTRSSTILRRIERWNAAAQRRLRRDKPLPGLRWGSQWFSITDDLARWVLSRREWIESTFSRSICADEHFLQTLVAGSPFSEQLLTSPDDADGGQGSARLIDWARGDAGSPHTWRMADLELLLAAPHAGFVFARKFSSAIDPDVVQAIAVRAGSADGSHA